MTIQEKLQALKAGEFDKVLEGTPYDANTHKDTWGYSAYFKAGEHTWLQADANAAKVEVTKGVLPVFENVIGTLILYARVSENGGAARYPATLAAAEEALTLLKTLREQL
jgi:hypothetical protein